MQILADLHTHTMVSHHAYSTLRENCIIAGQRDYKLIAITDHGYGAPDSANDWHFSSMWSVPRNVEGVWLLRGAEANIMQMDGSLDLNDHDQRFVDLLIASLHTYCVKPVDSNAHTEAYEGVLANAFVDIIGHPASLSFPFDEEYIVKLCAKTGKMLELNPHSILLSPPVVEIYRRLLRLCKRYDAMIALGSDAHICYEVGSFDETRKLLEEAGFPEELVFNADVDRILRYVNAKPQIRDKFPL